jgi:hypothetical protein
MPFRSFDFSRGTLRTGTDVSQLDPSVRVVFVSADGGCVLVDGSSRIFVVNGVSCPSRSPKHLSGTLLLEVHEEVGA